MRTYQTPAYSKHLCKQPDSSAPSQPSGSEATFLRLVFLKCLSADGSLSLVWTNLRVLLFINAFTYKLLNMIAIESPFVKDFRDFSETLKELHQTETFHDEKPSR